MTCISNSSCEIVIYISHYKCWTRVGGGEGAAGVLRRSFTEAGSSVSAGVGDGGVGGGGGGALLQTLEEEAEFSGKGSGGGRRGEPELRGKFVLMVRIENKWHNLDDITLSAVSMNHVSLCSDWRGTFSLLQIAQKCKMNTTKTQIFENLQIINTS